MTVDYKNTVFLPKTDFPMRAGLAQKEPEILKFWETQKVHAALAARDAKTCGQFILHDGPPYANGHIHIGHATNKILKDVANRCEAMQGKRINYVPGWDCHGLPIEWKIEEQYRAKGKDKDQVPVLQFRQECRDFAAHWMEVQTEEFQRLGIMGDWEKPYATMHHESEAIIAGEIHKFLLNGSLYRGERAVMWSTVEKTALADAEVEYHDHTSDVVWVSFPVVQTNCDKVRGAELVIWTTTPWTMPANRAIAYGAEFDYGVYEVVSIGENATARAGKKIVLATALAEAVQKAANIELKQLATLKGAELEGTLCAHPLRGQGYDFDVRVLPGDFVTTESGTGMVHIAPSHGLDDFTLGKQYGLEIPYTVEPDGRYVTSLPLFGGARVYNDQGKKGDANKRVIAALEEAGGLIAKGQHVHSYPHSWRSKAPLIFRTTPQWFIAMEDGNQIRAKSLQAIKDTRWVPGAGENRIRAMVESRPDWNISRQRAWGVPIAIFMHKETLEPLRDADVCKRIIDIFKSEGSDAWYKRDAQEFLGDKYNAADYTQIFDIVDVWFESGSTHAFVVEARDDLSSPADLYLEGSDQHRGWFQSSLLESVGTRGRAPFKAVLTHGFVLDEQGRKMSKSMGNVTAPEKVIEQYGADILRLWVCNTNYSEDVRIGNEILKQQADLYRRLRNTLRYLLGALADAPAPAKAGDPAAEVKVVEMPELEKWVLHRLAELDAHVHDCMARFDYNELFIALHEFCNSDLSAFYFDVRKDSLYCDAPSAPRRRAALWVMNQVFLHLTAWLAPILCFTAEEAWQHYAHKDAPSVHLRTMPDIAKSWHNPLRGERWAKIRAMRSIVTGQLEAMRADKTIGSALEASVTVTVPDAEMQKLLAEIDFRDLCIVSRMEVALGGDMNAEIRKIEDADKCERCWQYLPDVGANKLHPTVCARCAEAVDQVKLAA